MFERLKKLIDVWHDQAEVDALSQRDLDEMGVTREQLNHFMRMPGDVADRVAAMARIFGANPDDLQFPRADYANLLESCSHCKERAACDHALADPATRPEDCGFCRNAGAFAAA